jgi:predicted dehydrogenase
LKEIMRNIIIIGGGGIARRHIIGFQKSGRARVALIEPVETRRSALMSEFGLSEGYVNVSDAPLDGFDLAVICSPGHTHVAMMNRCLDAALPFLVEKPLSVTMDGVRAVVDRLRETSLPARVGFARRNGPEILALREQVQAGRIGELKLAYMNASQEFLKYRPDLRENYFAREETGGGAVLDLASHMIDLLIWIMGPVTDVSAINDRLGIDGIETEDTCLISLRFASGALANITINLFQKPNTGRFEFIGTKGNLLLEHAVLSFADDDSGTWKDQVDFMAGLQPQMAHQARFEKQADLLLDFLDGQDCHLCSVEEAYHNLRVALAAKTAWRERRIVRIADQAT